MRVSEIMTRDPACASQDTSLREVARLMVEHDCGEIPVLDAQRRPIGVITDRDIVCRVVAKGMDASELEVADCMTVPCVTVRADDKIGDCCDVLERHQIRRAPVVDASGACVGIVSQADVARYASKRHAAELVRAVSEPAGNGHAFA